MRQFYLQMHNLLDKIYIEQKELYFDLENFQRWVGTNYNWMFY